MNSERPTCIVTKAAANTGPRSSKAPGMAADITRPTSITPKSITRIGVARGSNQFVTQQVYCQPSHTANQSSRACSAPIGVRWPSR